MSPSAHADSFARDHLPAREAWPELRFERPELRFPERLNCAAAILDRRARGAWSGRPALVTPDATWSYRDLLLQANRIAQVLVEDMGLVAGNRVLLRAPNNPLLAACWFAALKAGAVPVPTLPMLRAGELATVLDKARISHALCDARLHEELETARRRCPALKYVGYFGHGGADSLERGARAKSGEFANADTAADDVALIAFTSGTTGVPKGTMHFHRDVIATCECFPRHTVGMKSGDLVAGTPSLAFTYGLGGLLHFPLYFGAASLLVERYTPESLLETASRMRVTTLFTGPTMYHALAALAGSYDLAGLRACISAGEALPVATRAAWERATGVKIIDGIGSSEMLYIFIAAAGEDIRPGATGKPVPGYRAAVLDAQGEPCAPGVVGRLAVKGPTGCRYLADPRQAEYVERGWNFTGDAYLVDEEGYFHYQSRTDDMIISAGYNIAGPEIESVLLMHPAVAECAAVGWPDERRGEIVKAYVVLRRGHAGDATLVKTLQDFVKQHIAPYKYPRAIEFMGDLPRTETGKLQRYKLRAHA
ncbi:MAG: AMP-binding protein [Betaproteobacteria bacterium]|nr:AMP-binding protein [Betaproteobacteria bacterium]